MLWFNVGRRRPNIKPALVECFVFAGMVIAAHCAQLHHRLIWWSGRFKTCWPNSGSEMALCLTHWANIQSFYVCYSPRHAIILCVGFTHVVGWQMDRGLGGLQEIDPTLGQRLHLCVGWVPGWSNLIPRCQQVNGQEKAVAFKTHPSMCVGHMYVQRIFPRKARCSRGRRPRSTSGAASLAVGKMVKRSSRSFLVHGWLSWLPRGCLSWLVNKYFSRPSCFCKVNIVLLQEVAGMAEHLLGSFAYTRWINHEYYFHGPTSLHEMIEITFFLST